MTPDVNAEQPGAARILIIDDNPQNAALVTAQLQRDGYAVTSASTGRTGLERAAADAPDVVLLDIMMPGMDGFEVCRALRADPHTRAVPVIVLTSLQERTDKLRALQAGADDFLSKPVDRAELLARVGSAVRAKRLYDELAESRDEISQQAHLLAAEKSRAEAVLYSMSDGVLTTDLEGRVTLLNPAAEAMFGITLESILGQPLGQALGLRTPSGQELDSAQLVEQAVRQEPRATTQAIAWCPGGRQVAVDMALAPVREAGGQPVALVVVCRDVTEQREIERAKREFVRLVSHELRTPMASIFGFSELLLDREPLTDAGREFATRIYQETQRLLTLLSDFLDLERLESGHLSYYPRSMRLDDSVAEVKSILGPQLGERRLVFTSEPTALFVRTDHDRLIQVLLNLVSNAIKYSDSGDIEVTARAVDSEVIVAVRDHGFGLPAESMAHLFDKFYRVDSPAHRQVGGTGLGLAICKLIIEEQGGRIWAESPGLGQGTTFFFTLARSEPADVAREPAEPHEGKAQGYILVVKDDPAFATLIRTQLSVAGYEVEGVATGEEALERARQRPPAAVVFDVGLAGQFDGFSVLLALRKMPGCSDVPVIMISGRRERARGLALGVNEFLVKPVPAQQLVAAVRRCAGEPQGRPILVADDDPAVRRAVVAALREGGFSTLEAADGGEALERLAEHEPAALILDLAMPNRDGFEVLDALRLDPSRRSIPVLVLTARQLTEQERRWLSAKVEALLLKSEHSGTEVVKALAGVLPRIHQPAPDC